MNWMPLYIAIFLFLTTMIFVTWIGSKQAKEGRKKMDEALNEGKKQLEAIKENNRLLEELNSLLRIKT